MQAWTHNSAALVGWPRILARTLPLSCDFGCGLLSHRLQGTTPRDQLIEHEADLGCVAGSRFEHAEVLEIGVEGHRDVRTHVRDLQFCSDPAKVLNGTDCSPSAPMAQI